MKTEVPGFSESLSCIQAIVGHAVGNTGRVSSTTFGYDRLSSSNVMAKTNTYLAYGVRIATSFPLDELPPAQGEPDVKIREGRISDSLVDSVMAGSRGFENPGARFRFSPSAMFARWDRVGKVLVRDGTDVIVETEEGVTAEDLAPFLTGPVLVALLHQRGCFVLHASCVSINGVAAVFVGPKGYGKSTLAAHLKARGHRLISDDIVPLSAGSEGIGMEPGFPRIKLYDDSIEAFGGNPSDCPTIHRFASKRSFQIKDPYDHSSIRLRSIYILDESDEFRITELSPASGFIEIMKNVHLGRFLEETESQAEYFQFCREITKTVPIFKLERPSSFSEMPNTLVGLELHTAKIAELMKHSISGREIKSLDVA